MLTKDSAGTKQKALTDVTHKSEHNVFSISAEEVKIKKYWNHFEHWDKNEYHFSAFCYKVRIEAHKECEVITIWMN